jgi:hypothetical protein
MDDEDVEITNYVALVTFAFALRRKRWEKKERI